MPPEPADTVGTAVRTGPLRLVGWQDVCRLAEIRPGRARTLLLNGTDVALFRDGEDVRALGGVCPHRGGPLAAGTAAAGVATCPLHGWEFDLRTGISPADPSRRVPTYRCRVVDGTVQVDADSVPPGPGRPDRYLGRWARPGADEHDLVTVHQLADGRPPPLDGTGPIRGDRATGYPSWDDLVFAPAQLCRPPREHDDVVETAVVLGTGAARPLRLAIPLLVGHLSYGALSIEAKVALARGAREAGTAIGSGDGGPHGRERDAADKYVMALAPGVPVTDEALAEADAVEIKIGEGGRPGLGGHLPAVKLSTEVGLHRDAPPGVAIRTPARGAALRTVADLRGYVDELRERTGGVPVGVKLAAGRVEDDLATACEIGVDYVTLDALGAGAEHAPAHIRAHVGLPGVAAVPRARRWLDTHGVRDVQLVASGGLRTPDEMAKALALGADAVALGTAALLAAGCQLYRACDTGACPVGIATQDPELRLRLNSDLSGRRVATFLRSATAMVADYCRVTGHGSVAALSADDLAALTPEAAAATGLSYLA